MKIYNCILSFWRKRQEEKRLKLIETMKSRVAAYHQEMEHCLNAISKNEDGHETKISLHPLNLGITSNILFKEDAVRFFKKLLGEQVAKDEVIPLSLEKDIADNFLWSCYLEADEGKKYVRDVWIYRGYYVIIGYKKCSYGYIHPKIYIPCETSLQTCFVGQRDNGTPLYLVYKFEENNIRLLRLENEGFHCETYEKREVTYSKLENDIEFWESRF